MSKEQKRRTIRIIIQGNCKARLPKEAIESIGRGGPMRPKKGKGSYKRKPKHPNREKV
jgi:hypothetical protein